MNPAKKPTNKKCCPRAYQLFESQLDKLDSTDGLVMAAIGLSLHALDDVEPEDVCRQLGSFADGVRGRIRSDHVSAKLSHLHEVLFEEEGFVGNSAGYYDVLNSLLPAVVESRKGIPVTLALVYKSVAEQIGLEVRGINSPGHFLVEIRDEQDWMIVDPFDRGKALTRQEAGRRVSKACGLPEDQAICTLQPSTSKQWLNRILTNLRHNLSRQNRIHDLEAMTELHELLHTF